MTFSAAGGLNNTAGVRFPLVQSASDQVLQMQAIARKALVATSAASIRWGKPSDFSVVGPGTVTVIWPPDVPPTDPSQEEPGPFQYNEEWRKTSKVRVENPDDAEQYVMVERVESIIFRGEDNRRIQLNFVNGKTG